MENTFHITIKDNENNEVILDMDTNCFIGAINQEDSCSGVSQVNCKGRDLVAVFVTLMKTARSAMTTGEGDDTLFIASLMAWIENNMKEIKQ